MNTITITNRWAPSVVVYRGQHADLREAVEHCVATRVSLREADLRGSMLGGSKLSGGDLRGAYLNESDLSQADLSGSDLREANLSDACLSKSDLREANLHRSKLIQADLRGADLRKSDLSNANLIDSDLSRANLRGAILSRAYLDGAKLPGPPGRPPTSLKEAAQRTRDWLAGHRWLSGDWIETPGGAYSGDCKACLHGAALYLCGPKFGPMLSDKLAQFGYTADWNDGDGRTEEDILAALDNVIEYLDETEEVRR